MANGYGSSTSSSLQNLNATSSNGQTNGIKKITNLKVDTSIMSAAITSRRIIVSGEIGARFLLNIVKNPTSSSDMTQYYNFFDRTFEAGHNSKKNNLEITLKRRTENIDIIFPTGAGTGGTYNIKLITFLETEVVGYKTKNIISETIEKQEDNSTITFRAASLANPLNYAATPTGTTSTGAITDTNSVNFDWTITNASTDAGGFGLILKDGYKELNEKVLYVKTTTDVVSQPAGEAEVTVDSLTDIAVGSYLWSGTGLSGTPRITAIDTENKILTLSSVQTINDGVTLTVKSYGIESIKNAIGVTLAFTPVTGGIGNSPRFILSHLTKTVRDGGGGVTDAVDGDSTTISLSDTHGIAGGEVVTYFGVGVDNTATNRVTVVTPDCPDLTDSGNLDNDGKIVVELAQTLTAGTVLKFVGSHKSVQIIGGISISGYPSANKTIYFDLDEPLSVGANT